MLASRFATLLLLLGSSTALAGAVETGVSICGVSSQYLRYGQSAPAITGTSSTGLRDQVFRIKGFHYVEGNRSNLISATQINGIQLCVEGNLETVKHGEKTAYYILPKNYEIKENPDEYLNLTQIVGLYSGSTEVSINAFEDGDGTAKFYSAELPILLKNRFNLSCHSIENAISNPNALAFTMIRKDKTLLSASLTVSCDKTHPDDTIKIQLEFLGQNNSQIALHIHADRPLKNTAIVIDGTRPSR